MNRKHKLAELASIDNSVLARVAGGGYLDLYSSWAFNSFASQSCRNAVFGAASRAYNHVQARNARNWEYDAWSAANDAANDEWNNGSACSYYGYSW